MRKTLHSTSGRVFQNLHRNSSTKRTLTRAATLFPSSLSLNQHMRDYSIGSTLPAQFVSVRSFGSSSTEPAKAPEKQFTDIYVDIQFDTLTDMIEKTCKHHGNNRCLGTRNGSVFDWLSYREMYEFVGKTRNILSQLGINRNDKVAIISNNRWEWVMIMYATLGRGGQLVPMYEAQLEKDWKYIVEDSDAKVIVAATEVIYNQIKDYPSKKVGKAQTVLCLDAKEDQPHSYK
jgi:non-ribosomal peptide synthetase component E (peptide arylation enzyme)